MRTVASSSPDRISATPRSWKTDGASARIKTPRKTDATGWMVSTTEVMAAGSRGRLMLISSQPTTWTPSARRSSQPCDGQLGTSSISPSGSPTARVTNAAASDASKSGPAGRRTSAFAPR
jgi:hypothetical protein